MRRKLSVLLTSVVAIGALQLAAPAPASACTDPYCPWSPVTGFVHDTIDFVQRTCDHIDLINPKPCP